MKTTVLGLDLGTYCGHALLSVVTDKGIMSASGTWDCSYRRDVDSPSVRLEKFEQNLTSTLQCGVDKVFYEVVRRHKGTQAAHIYGALKSKMMEVCDRLGISFEGLEVGEVKKFATGKGNAGKSAMVDAVRRWGFAVADDADDEADAICIARCGWETRT